ncbi:helix-turn-helix transcriptional regulator [Bacillus sp. 2205SS5-2]|uniref:helix-turn-helix transcriptional regulator n=1 Tax=Bacillus sp. 2205SS5-2 TaxID=3109031 RepID=UPI003007375F
MIRIVIKLLNNKRVTAKQLAEEFEVSVRTIQRDIDSINIAGIPVIFYKGAHGGYGLVEGYKLTSHFLNEIEHKLLMTSLYGVYSAYDDTQVKMLIEKFSVMRSTPLSTSPSSVQFDFSGWGPTSKRTKKIVYR